MKSLRGAFIWVAAIGAMAVLSGVSFAQAPQSAAKDPAARKARHEAKIKLLQDSSAALGQTNPELSKKLSDLANEEMNESMGKMEKTDKSSADWAAKHEARMKIITDASAALMQSRPDLAKSLEEMTVPKHKVMMQNMAGEKNEKEEAGEKLEPKSEAGEKK